MESSKKIPAEVKDRIVKETYDRIQVYEAQGVLTPETLYEIRAWLVEQEEVDEVLTAYQTDLTVRFADGTQIGILLGRRQAYGPSDRPVMLKGGGEAQNVEDAGE